MMGIVTDLGTGESMPVAEFIAQENTAARDARLASEEGGRLSDLFDNVPAPDPIETRWYIGMVKFGRMSCQVGPGPASSFTLGPHDPMPLGEDGGALSPVGHATYEAWIRDLDEDEDGDE